MTAVPYTYLRTPPELAAYLAALRDEPLVALDFEADSLHSYREKVCLAQVSTPAGNTVLDALAGDRVLEGLGPVLADPGIRKVFHGGDYDVRLLKRGYGFAVRNLFDTMIAAQLVGRQRVGLAALLEEEFEVALDKKYQRADWSERPLGPELLAYAALDTAYLLALAERLNAELARLGRREWAAEEFRLLEAVEPGPERGPWCLDVKGAGRFTPRQLAVLQALLEVREAEARQRDRPPFKVLSAEVLLAWAQKPPASRREVLETPRAGAGVLQRLAGEILAAVERALALPDDACPRPSFSPRPPLDAAQEKRLKGLKKVRAEASARLGIEPGLLVNSATLERLARLPPEEAAGTLPGQLKAWQEEAVGEALRGVLAG
ncbi:MAG: HRDC domain-containing protein [Thermodesulfobacteriota bacterium]|jgi:ribonuclease D